MRYFLLLASMLAMAVLSLLSMKQLSDSDDIAQKIKNTSQQTLQLKNDLKTILQCRQEPATPLILSYRDLHNYVNLVSDYHGTEAVLKIPNYKDQVSIEKYFQDSNLSGIRKLNMDLIFRKEGSISNQISILDSLLVSSRQLSLEVVSVSESKDTLTVNINLYGV